MSGLGDYGDGGFGDDGFGWDGMGDPTAAWHPAWGALAGSSVSSGVAIGVRQLADDVKWKKWAEAFGLCAGLLLGGAAVFYGPSRAAGWTAIASAAGSGVPRLLEDLLINYAEEGTAAEGVGMASINRVGRVVGVARNGAGMPVLERTRAVAGGGVGAAPRLLGRSPRLLGSRTVGIGAMAGHFGSSAMARAA